MIRALRMFLWFLLVAIIVTTPCYFLIYDRP